MTLGVVVHQVVDAAGDEVGDERVHLRLGVVGLESRSDGGVHLCRGRVVRQVNGCVANLLEVVDGLTTFVSAQRDVFIFHVTTDGVCRWNEIDDTHRIGRWSWQLIHYLIAELLNSGQHLVYLSSRVGLGLQIIVEQRVLHLNNQLLKTTLCASGAFCLSINSLGVCNHLSLGCGLVQYLLNLVAGLCQSVICHDLYLF